MSRAGETRIWGYCVRTWNSAGEIPNQSKSPTETSQVVSEHMSLDFHNKPSLVAYVTCGDPNLATTHEIVLATIDAGADVIEIGVPFSDPIADGPVIQRASERALVAGANLRRILTELVPRVRERVPGPPLVAAMSEEGLALVPLCAPTTSAERATEIARAAKGFVYCVAVAGVTGER